MGTSGTCSKSLEASPASLNRAIALAERRSASEGWPVPDNAVASAEPSETEPSGLNVNESRLKTLTGKPSCRVGCQRHWRRDSIAHHPSNRSPDATPADIAVPSS